MEDPTVVWKYMTLPVKYYTLFMKDVCEFVLPFRSSGPLTGLHAKEKCTCDKLANGCVHMGVCLLVDVKY